MTVVIFIPDYTLLPRGTLQKKIDTRTPNSNKMNFWVSESAKVGLKISQVIQMCSLS